jgi:hypothetical protein
MVGKRRERGSYDDRDWGGRDKSMRTADFGPKWKRSSNAEYALDYLCVESPFWVGVILILESSFVRGAAVLLCWALFLVLMFRRECKMQLNADRHERGSFPARTVFLGALLLIVVPAYLHERWIVVTFAAALMIAGLITVIAALAILRRAMERI